MIGIANDLLLDLAVIVPIGIRAEPLTFLRIVAIDETDATAADQRILVHDAFHENHHLVWLIEMILNLIHMIDGPRGNFGKHPAYLLVGSAQVALVDISLLHHHQIFCGVIDEPRNQSHDDELGNTYPSRQSFGKGTKLLFCHSYSFCSTSISVKVSMISPTWMSLKFTSEIPHSRPVATSLASSL